MSVKTARGRKKFILSSKAPLKEVDPLLKDIIKDNKFYSTNRGDLATISFPTIVYIGTQTLHPVCPKEVTDISIVTLIPSQSVCEDMLKSLGKGKYKAVTCSVGTYTRSSLDTLLNIHKLRDISQRVKRELKWLNITPPLPNSQCVPPGFLESFKKLLFENKNDRVVIDKGVLASDLGTLTCNNWVNIATTQGFIDLLNANDFNMETAAFILNDLLLFNQTDILKYARTVRRGRAINYIVFVINVAGNIKKTCVASPNNPGCHWSLLYIDAVENTWFYCDTLGWVPPTDLNSKVDSILNVLSQEFTLFRKPAHGRFIAHKVQGNSYVSHKCIDACFQNIPLQSCGSICGVIVVAMGAISCINSTLWRSGFLGTKSSLPVEISWIKNPTLHSCYLRRVLIHWITAQDVDLQLLGIKPSVPESQYNRNRLSSSTYDDGREQPVLKTSEIPMVDLTEESSQDRDEVADQDLAKQTEEKEEKEPAHEADRKAAEAAPCEVEEKAVQGAGQEADGEAAEVASSCELTEDTVHAEPAPETDLEAAETAPCELTEVTGQEPAQEVDRETVGVAPSELGAEGVQEPLQEADWEAAQATPCEQAEEAVHGSAHGVGQVTAQQEGKRLAEARQDAAKQEIVDRTDKEPKSEEHCQIEKEALSELEQDADWKAAEEQGQEGHGIPAKETDQAPLQEPEQGRCDKATTTVAPEGFQCPYCNLTSSVKSNLRRHIRRKHGDQMNDPSTQECGKCLCLQCQFNCHRISDLRQHLSKTHEVVFKTETRTFSTFAGRDNT